MTGRPWILVAAALAVALVGSATTLELYFIDVEGGQATLIVIPGGETLLVDSGYAGRGTFQSRPSNPRQARDAQRIAATARGAGVKRIDYLLVTHFHQDHDGGVPELAQLMPIGTFIDHGTVPAEAERTVAGALDAFRAYSATRDKGRHLEPHPGDRLPIKGAEVIVVSSAGATIANSLPLAGQANPACAPSELAAAESTENPRSTGIVLEFGQFRFLDLGDLTGRPLYNLVCPTNQVGSVDMYLVAHHGGRDAADPATLAAFRPRVAVLNNGAVKGGDPEMFTVLRTAQVPEVWQLHRAQKQDAANFPGDQIANLDESTTYGIRVSANRDGSFLVRNERTGFVRRFPARAAEDLRRK
jgi:beta-lactamase superfamily II metal-dependent hydrolase